MIFLKSPEEIEIMRVANLIVAEILATLQEHVKPGVTTADLDQLAEELTRKKGAESAFKGYRVGDRVFPASLCTSINEEVVHGIPSLHRVVKEGDLLSLDFGVKYQGFYGDAAITVSVGKVNGQAQSLVHVARETLSAAIDVARPGRRLGDISAAIQENVEQKGFSVVREFVGHGIGRHLHEEPPVPNFGVPDRGVRLREGMVLAIEPMVNAGGPDVWVKDDGWTAVTRDGSLSAHFEHSVAVTGKGPYILSQLP